MIVRRSRDALTHTGWTPRGSPAASICSYRSQASATLSNSSRSRSRSRSRSNSSRSSLPTPLCVTGQAYRPTSTFNCRPAHSSIGHWPSHLHYRAWPTTPSSPPTPRQHPTALATSSCHRQPRCSTARLICHQTRRTRSFGTGARIEKMVATKLDGTAIAKTIRERLGAEIVEKQKLNPRYRPALRIIQGMIFHSRPCVVL
jgi:hypothetical protein